MNRINNNKQNYKIFKEITMKLKKSKLFITKIVNKLSNRDKKGRE